MPSCGSCGATAEAGVWRWRLRTELDIGGIPPPYMENLPFTVDPASGRPALNRRMFTSSLLLFSDVDPRRWR